MVMNMNELHRLIKTLTLEEQTKLLLELVIIMHKQEPTSYQEALYQIRHLPSDEQRGLLTILLANISQNATMPRTGSWRKITEFKGMDKESWAGIDVEKYIDEERNSWD